MDQRHTAIAHIEFEEAVNVQPLAVVDKLDAASAALGLSLAWPNDTRPLAVRDVQIWSDGAFSCRPIPGANAATNGSQAAAYPTQAVPE